MKNKILHVVSSHSATIKIGFDIINIKDEISCFPINLSFGYLPKDFSDKEIAFCLASHHLFSTQYIKCFEEFKQFISTDYSVYDKVIVWHGGLASDLLLLYLVSVLVKEKLYQIDIRDCVALFKKISSKPFCGIGFICPEDISLYNLISLAKPLSKETMHHCKEKWFKWTNNNSMVRLNDITTGEIKTYPENFVDDLIIEAARKNLNLGNFSGFIALKTGRDIGLYDYIILSRISHLIAKHKIGVSFSAKGSE